MCIGCKNQKVKVESDLIITLYDRGWYAECLYALGLLDYLSGINDVPICSRYDKFRGMRLEKTIFPLGIIAISNVTGNDDAKNKALKEAIPEFMRFNIVEGNIRDVI